MGWKSLLAVVLMVTAVAPARGQDPAAPGPVRSQRFAPATTPPTALAVPSLQDDPVRCADSDRCVVATVAGGLAGAVLLAGVGAGIGNLASQGGCDPMHYATQSACERDNMIGGAVMGWPLGAPVGAWLGSSRRISFGRALLGSAGAWSLLGGLWLIAALDGDGQGAATAIAVVAPPAIVVTSVVVGLRGEP